MLLVAQRRGRISQAQSARFITLLRQLPISTDPAPVELDTLVAAGRHHELSTYDAAYFTLAEREGLPFATGDRKLTTAAHTTGIPLLIPQNA